MNVIDVFRCIIANIEAAVAQCLPQAMSRDENMPLKETYHV